MFLHDGIRARSDRDEVDRISFVFMIDYFGNCLGRDFSAAKIAAI